MARNLIGQTISHYQILDKLGEGGMGVVYRARDERLQREVAIKVLPPEVADDPGRLDRFETEALALAKQNHPHIVAIYEVDKQDKISFLVMELVEGETLAHLIPRRGFRLQRLFGLAIPLAEAVGAAHDQQVIHRDLKPGNVMVTPEGRLKVLDFGLAELRGLDSLASQSTTATAPTPQATRGPGTVQYMSPEQLRGETVDHRSDIFSLGIILYEMSTGRHPFLGRSGADSATSILRDQPPDVDELRMSLPRHLGRMIRQCLDKRPERRLQSAKDLAIGLNDLRRELTSSTEETRVPALRKRSLRPYLLGTGLAVVLAVAALVVWDQTRTDMVNAPRHLSATSFRGFSGDTTEPEYFRAGVVDTLRLPKPICISRRMFGGPRNVVSVSYRLHQPGKDGIQLGGDS